MSSLILTAAVFKWLVLLLVIALATKKVHGRRDLECQTLALHLYTFAKPSSNLDCKQSCDERYASLREMPKYPVKGFHSLSSSQTRLKAYADADTKGIFWSDECLAWIRYCFRQKAAILTIDKNALDSQHSSSAGPALTCLCRSVLLLVQIRKDSKNGPQFCKQQTLCQRLTSRINLMEYGFWSCKEAKHIMDTYCSLAAPVCPCCQKGKNQNIPEPCPDWPEIDELMNEPFVLGDQEWLPYDLHGAPQPEEGFSLGTVLEPQGPACPAVEHEGPPRFKAASLPFRTFDKSTCGQAGSCAAESSGASQMHCHFEGMSEARERTHQLRECFRPPQKQGTKRKAAATAEVACSIGGLASIEQPQNGETSHGPQFPGAYPSPFTTMDDDGFFFGSQHVFSQASSGESHSMGIGASGIDPDNLQFDQVFAEFNSLAAEPATMTLDPDNLRFSDYFGAAVSTAPTESISPEGPSNPDDLAKEQKDSQHALEGIP